MRLTIIPSEDKISINGEPIVGCDVSWIPEFVGDITGVSQKVHAVQWNDDHGEIELVTRDNSIVITELGVFEQAIIKYEERKLAIKAEVKAAEEAAATLRADSIYMDIDMLLAELESEETLESGETLELNN
jgi:hypothetical protein